MNENPNSQSLKLLFATFPPQAGDLAAMLEAYDVALEGHDGRDVGAAVRRFIRGEVTGHNPAFAPSAAMLGAAVRQCMNDRLDSESRARKPALPPPDIEKTDESRARVKAMVAQVVADTAARLRATDADKLKQGQSWNDRLDARFMPDQKPDAIKARLGFSAGDRDGDREVA